MPKVILGRARANKKYKKGRKVNVQPLVGIDAVVNALRQLENPRSK